MAKDLPYFKFDAAEWITGNITLEDYEVQGLFINICAHYWFKSGCLTLTEIKRRLIKDNRSLDSLVSAGLIVVSNDVIAIKFLDEQINNLKQLSVTNSNNGSKGGAPKGNKNAIKQPKTTEEQPKSSNIEEKRREDIYIHGDGKFSITVNKVYANEKIQKIFDLKLYFEHTNQLHDFIEAGWIHFQPFIDENPGRVFNDSLHLYNTFKDFCTMKYKPPPKIEKFKDPEYDKTIWTLETWEKTYAYDLKNNLEFRKYFGYGELSISKAMGSGP